MNVLIRDLKLSKIDSQVLASRLQQWNCLDKSTKVSFYRNRSDPFSVYFTTTENICYCNNLDGLFEALRLQHIPKDWRLFIDGSKSSLKVARLRNGNNLPTIPLAYAVNTRETYERIAHIFLLIQYNKYKWKVCADFKVNNTV